MKCGTFDSFGKQQKCDMCTLVRSNPIGESGPKRPMVIQIELFNDSKFYATKVIW